MDVVIFYCILLYSIVTPTKDRHVEHGGPLWVSPCSNLNECFLVEAKCVVSHKICSPKNKAKYFKRKLKSYLENSGKVKNNFISYLFYE